MRNNDRKEQFMWISKNTNLWNIFEACTDVGNVPIVWTTSTEINDIQDPSLFCLVKWCLGFEGIQPLTAACGLQLPKILQYYKMAFYLQLVMTCQIAAFQLNNFSSFGY